MERVVRSLKANLQEINEQAPLCKFCGAKTIYIPTNHRYLCLDCNAFFDCLTKLWVKCG